MLKEIQLNQSYKSYFDDSEFWIYKSSLKKDNTYIIIDCHDDWSRRDISKINEMSIYILALGNVSSEEIISTFFSLSNIQIDSNQIIINRDTFGNKLYKSSFIKSKLFHAGVYSASTPHEEMPLKNEIESVIKEIVF